ncbi:MAG: putative addiction module antidote protein [Alphaproteobacteria bacterium]|nr:putative addiction module antidote protein [Alphaproteobacteria bacterium]
MTTVTTAFDIADYLDSEERIAAWLDAAMAEGDPGAIAKAIGDVARARGMTAVADAAGLRRETLYNALAETGNPTLTTLLGVMRALGVRLAVVPRSAP